MLETIVVWVIFYDPGNGDQTSPIGPFENILVVDNHLIQTPRDPGQPLADGEKAKRLIAAYEMNAPEGGDWRKHRGWHLQSSHWAQAGVEGPALFPQFKLEFRLPPPIRRFTIKVREIADVTYEVEARTAQEAQEMLRNESNCAVVDRDIEEQIIGNVEETTELPEEGV